MAGVKETDSGVSQPAGLQLAELNQRSGGIGQRDQPHTESRRSEHERTPQLVCLRYSGTVKTLEEKLYVEQMKEKYDTETTGEHQENLCQMTCCILIAKYGCPMRRALARAGDRSLGDEDDESPMEGSGYRAYSLACAAGAKLNSV